MKLGVWTSYQINDSLYSSYVLGANINSINKTIERRNLNESIDSTITEITHTLPDYSLLSDEEIINRKEELLHSLCFLSFIGLKSKKIKIEEVLGDEGILHELSHLVSGSCLDKKKTLDNVRVLLTKLQKSAIGLYVPV